MKRVPGRAPGRNLWTKQQPRPWPRSRERRARGFPPAPSLTRDRRPLGFQPLGSHPSGFQRLLPRPQAASAPRLSPAPPLTLGGLAPAPGARACEGGRRQGRSAAGASAHALSWDPLQAWVSTCGGRLGKRLGCWGSGPPRQGGEGLRTRDARRVCAQRASGLSATFPSEALC